MAYADLPPPYPGKNATSSDSDSLRSCPNGCQSGALTQGQLKEHLLDCPLELVECEFSTAGCNERVPRRDLARHMTENAQQHLMSATLLNLRQTRELRQKMERQITDLQRQVKALSTTSGFICHDLILREFTICQETSPTGTWYSKIVSDGLGLVQAQLRIDTNGIHPGTGHMTAILCCTNYVGDTYGGYGLNVHKANTLVVVLHMLNQLGDSGHHVVVEKIRTDNLKNPQALARGFKKEEYFRLAGLSLNSTARTQYLLNDTLHFKLYLRVEFEHFATFPQTTCRCTSRDT